MSKQIFLVRVSYLVPVVADDERAAEDYLANEADFESLDDALQAALEDDKAGEVIQVERTLSALDMEGPDRETWGDVVPLHTEPADETDETIHQLLLSEDSSGESFTTFGLRSEGC